MPPAAEKSPSGRRIFSRIASPFSPTSRTLAEFSVIPTDEHKKYSPGDIVTGHVRLRVVKPIRITHLVVCLHGFVQVYKTPGSPPEGFRSNTGYLGTGRGKKSGEYFGNGFASLFEDEEVLCGDGRLAEGEYQFNFELEFPDHSLPSSIEFERGTISYMITATLTRPTAMSPTITCDRKLNLVETIDISSLYPPKPRTITLEAVSKRARTKNPARKLMSASEKSRSSVSFQHSADTPRQSEASSTPSVPSAPVSRADNRSPGSPVPSEVSNGSRFSTNRRESQPESESQESPSSTPTPSEADKANSSRVSLADKIITTSIESQTGGCLQGDYIPVKIFISHTKQVKSVYGVILTLYRQARVDMHPDMPLGPIEKGKSDKFESYYPKSLTGLGGLSLSGAGSTHVFRKDLSQSISPLYIDMQTLEAEVNAKVRVPEEAFPTIASVPGSMISFKYYVEVIVDIQGKLQGQEKSANNLSGQAAPTGHYLNSEVSDMERSAFTPFGSTVIDTSSVRRDKGVVTCTLEVIVGTKDSDRRKGKRKMATPVEPENPPLARPVQDRSPDDRNPHPDYQWYGPDGYYGDHWYDEQYAYYYGTPDQWNAFYRDQSYQHYPPPLMPIPQMPDETQMTEKERIRQAETRLLPSQPPGIDGGQPSDSTVEATAPFIPEESRDLAAETSMPPVPEYAEASSSGAARALDRVDEASQSHVTWAPPATPYSHATPAVSDDKQEMQRQLLQANESAPPVDGEDDQSGLPPPAATLASPTAPTLDEVGEVLPDERDSHADAAGSLELPKYER